MTGTRMKRGNLDIETYTERQPCEDQGRLKGCFHKPKDAQDFQQTTKARNTFFTAFRRKQPVVTLISDFQPPNCETVHSCHLLCKLPSWRYILCYGSSSKRCDEEVIITLSPPRTGLWIRRVRTECEMVVIVPFSTQNSVMFIFLDDISPNKAFLIFWIFIMKHSNSRYWYSFPCQDGNTWTG